MKQGFKLIKVKLEEQRSIVLFRINPYQPVLVPFLYLVLSLKGQAFKTIQGKFTAIKYLYSYYSITLDMDLDELLINPKRQQIIFNNLNSFIAHLNYDNELIGIRTRAIYIQAITEFLIWCNKRYHGPSQLAASIKSLSNTFLRSLPSSTPNSNASLTEQELNLIIRYSDPSAEENRFREENRNRNFILISILISTGIRIGELLKLKSSDIYQVDDRCYIEVVNRENEIEDTRSDEPGLKNNQSQRAISITQDLYSAIQNFITHNRRPIREGRKMKLAHGYLLTSERGSPLSKGSVYDILASLREFIIHDRHKFKASLSPHAFRHSFAENYLEHLVDVKGLDMERAKDQLRTIGGWSVTSAMPSFYAKKYIGRSANSFNIDRINNAMKKSNG